MKKIIYTAALAITTVVSLSSCEDFLNPQSKTSITYDYIASTPDGLARAVVGLYDIEREMVTNDESDLMIVRMCDYNTDIMVYRGGTAAQYARLESFLPSTGQVSRLWTHYYELIGKANEVIVNAENVGLDDPSVKKSWSEAKFFRGYSYFELWKRYERLYLNLLPTTVDNLKRDYTPATREEIFEVIRNDLDDAISGIDWGIPDNQYGRITKATATHVRAQVAMWDEDWNLAIELCESIFTEGTMYKMAAHAQDVFNSADLRNPEVLWSYQFSKNAGGGGKNTPLDGHRMSLVTQSRYQSVAGCTFEAAQGGYGWGRVYPNTHLFSLYDQAHDTRYKELFVHDFYYNDPAKAETYGKVIPKDLYGTSAGYLERLHPMSKKYFDSWTNQDQPDRTSSFKDVIVFRLAETYLMCCEAYFHRDGGSSPQAIEYYNKTWERAGNAPEAGPLTLETILDEYARELNFEGVRWPQLKRLGLLGQYVRQWAGDTKVSDPYLDTDYIQVRGNFVDGKNETWPIPQTQVDLMGPNFPQSDPWK
jgi:hypothetical protein